MNKKNNKRRRESQQKMEEAFFKLIEKREAEEISVTSICELAQVNRSTFYANYTDMNGLLEQIKENMFADLKNLYESEPIGEAEDWNERFLKLFVHIKKNQEFFRIYFKLGFDLNFEYSERIVMTLSPQIDKRFLEYHIEFLKGGIVSLTKRWLNNGCRISPEELVDILKNEYNYFF